MKMGKNGLAWFALGFGALGLATTAIGLPVMATEFNKTKAQSRDALLQLADGLEKVVNGMRVLGIDENLINELQAQINAAPNDPRFMERAREMMSTLPDFNDPEAVQAWFAQVVRGNDNDGA